MQPLLESSDVEAIGAVFDAAVRAGRTYLREVVEEPMFSPEDCDQLVTDHAPPNVLLLAADQAGQVAGYAAAHPEDGEMFLLVVHPAYGGCGVGWTLLCARRHAALGRLQAGLPVALSRWCGS